MTDANKDDVTFCLGTPAAEKKIRYAARSLFMKINSVHKETLSKEEYIDAINSLTAGHEKERKILLAAGELCLLGKDIYNVKIYKYEMNNRLNDKKCLDIRQNLLIALGKS